MSTDDLVRDLRDALATVDHGSCNAATHTSRDPGCPACQVLARADAYLAEDGDRAMVAFAKLNELANCHEITDYLSWLRDESAAAARALRPGMSMDWKANITERRDVFQEAAERLTIILAKYPPEI